MVLPLTARPNRLTVGGCHAYWFYSHMFSTIYATYPVGGCHEYWFCSHILYVLKHLCHISCGWVSRILVLFSLLHVYIIYICSPPFMPRIVRVGVTNVLVLFSYVLNHSCQGGSFSINTIFKVKKWVRIERIKHTKRQTDTHTHTHQV